MRYWESSRKRSPRTQRRARPSARSIASGGSVRQYPFLRKFYQHQTAIGEGFQKFIFFLILALLVYAFVLGDGGIIRITNLKGQKADLEDDVALVNTSIEQLQLEIDRLENDPFIMEKLGRERFGYIYPGDWVYKIIPSVEGD